MDLRELSTQQIGSVNWADGSLAGRHVHESVKVFGDMSEMFLFHDADNMSPTTVLYRVQWVEPESQSAKGALLFGCTVIESGQVGNEYFMTHGHFHQRPDRGEIYATLAGQGALILMDENRRTWMEPMSPGSLHFIPGTVAHRVSNTGPVPFRFVACWPTDAGHDYASIKEVGFGARLLCRNGVPVLVGAKL